MAAPPPRFGWIPPSERTPEQQRIHWRIRERMPAYAAPRKSKGKGRYAVWSFAKKLLGETLPLINQTTGSCVGAGGMNMLLMLICCEIVNGDLERYTPVWWPFTYGQSRRRGGMNGQGEGSFGSAWAEAIEKDGIFAREQADGLPEFEVRDGWLKLTRQTEMKWSDGRATIDKYGELGRKHPVKTVTPVKSTDEGRLLLEGGYPWTIASNFGTNDVRPRGNPAVNIGTWSANWPHQMSVSEVWDHPSEGTLFYIQNNWGSDAHPRPTQGEPPGGFYVTESTMSQIIRSRGSEVYAFSNFQGFPSRDLDWYF